MSFWSNRVETTVDITWRLLVRVFWRVLVIGGAVFAAYRLRSIITTLIVSAIIAYVLDPAVEWLCHQVAFTRFHGQCFAAWARFRGRFSPHSKVHSIHCKHHTMRLIAASYVFIIAIIALWQGARLIVTPFATEIKRVTSPQGRMELTKKKDAFLRWYDKIVPDWAQSSNIQDQIQSADLSGPLQKMGAEVVKGVLESAKGIVEIVLIPVLAFYALIDGRRLKHEFVGLLPKKNRRETVRTLNDFNRIMRAYISGQFILCVLAGVIVGIWLHALHTKYEVTLAIFAGLTRAIPVVGPIFGAIPIMLLVLATPEQGPGVAIAFAIFFSILHLVETKFIMPLLIGDRIELHPVIIIVVLLIGGEVGGLLVGNSLGAILGMFFAAPFAALIRVMVRRYWLRLPNKPSGPSAGATVAVPAPEIALRTPKMVK